MSLDHLIGKLRTSSLSDTKAYRALCRAATMDLMFRDFRRNQTYTRILEHVTQAQGQAYYDEILRLDEKLLLEYPQWYKDNDKYGEPEVFEYPDVGHVSPTTLRYVKVLADLRALFGPIGHRRVVEVGGGYGGQARIVHGREPFADYTIVDLPEPLALAEKFLDRFAAQHVRYINGEEFVANARQRLYGDLFISNYALTECAPNVMDEYIRRIAYHFPRGYIIGNAQKKRLLRLLDPLQARCHDEVPLTGEGNFLCVWGAS